MSEETTAVVRRDGVASIGTRARGLFDPEQVRLIKATVAKDCSDAELGLFLELCARYELDPFCKEIYAAKMGGKNGSSGSVVTIVGRDGLLKIAGRTGEFNGIVGDVVHAGDSFTKSSASEMPDHSYTLGGVGKDGKPVERGQIIGAWAVAYREGRKATYFFAPLNEYFPKSDAKAAYSPWSSQVSAMILKCAESMALRKAFSITGLVGEDEMGPALAREAAVQEMIEWGDDRSLAAWLPKLFEAANAARDDAYRPAKIRTLLRGRSDEDREVLANQLVAQIVEWGGEVPTRLSEEELDAVEGEVVQDAVMVDENGEVVPAEGHPYVAQDPDEIPFPDSTAEAEAASEAEASDGSDEG